jgi:transposase
VLANATAVRNLPGRKSDVRDAQWLADLLAHGLVRGSFVPPAPIQALRELTRTRKQLGPEVTAHSQRIEKVLESADVKLAAVLRPLLGVSGRAIIAALAAGETDPERLVALAHPRLRAKRAALRAALPGHVRPHHRVLLRAHLRVVATLQATIAELDAAIGAALAPHRAAVEHLVTIPGRIASCTAAEADAVARLDTIPGVARRTVETIVAELGCDMTRFPTAGHAASWAGLCPGNHESAGKRLSGRTRFANRILRQALVESARGAVCKHDSSLAA